MHLGVALECFRAFGLNERNGGTTIKKVLEGSMILIDGSKVKITGWYNVLNTFNYVE
jgi:hypothetical protein